MLGTIGPRTRWSLILGGPWSPGRSWRWGSTTGSSASSRTTGSTSPRRGRSATGTATACRGARASRRRSTRSASRRLLALAFRLDPRPPSLEHEVSIARGLVILGGWGFFLGTYAWLRRVGAGAALACLIVLATAFHHVVMIGGAATLFADLPFAAVTYGLLARSAARPRRGGGDVAPSWVDGALAGFGFLLRTNGITLIAASLVGSALGRRRRPEARLRRSGGGPGRPACSGRPWWWPPRPGTRGGTPGSSRRTATSWSCGRGGRRPGRARGSWPGTWRRWPSSSRRGCSRRRRPTSTRSSAPFATDRRWPG